MNNAVTPAVEDGLTPGRRSTVVVQGQGRRDAQDGTTPDTGPTCQREDSVASATAAGRKEQHYEGAGAHMSRGLRADRRILTAKVERQAAAIADLKEQIATLEQQRQRWLGTQLNADASIDPEAHAELRITNERLTAQNASLITQVAELRRINTILEADLAASRQAHAEDVANLLTDTDASVTTLASRR